MSSRPHWEDVCQQKRRSQQDAIPSKWLLPEPPLSVYSSVLDVPANCGLLTTRELKITETTDVHIILDNLRTMEWSSVEVTTAFYKRAIIAHQLVSDSSQVID
jgi:amidase